MRKYVSNKIKIVPTFTKDDLIDALITEFDAPLDIREARCRKRIYSDARKAYCKIAVYDMGYTRLNIAKDFPGYDHSIVIYSIDILAINALHNLWRPKIRADQTCYLLQNL